MRERAHDKFLIVAVDGGGVRGVVPAMLLEDLATHADLRFDRVTLLAGTSAGSLIALGLGAGVDIVDIANVFKDQDSARKIFTPNPGGKPTRQKGILGFFIRLLERLVRGRHSGIRGKINALLFPMYTMDGLRDIVNRQVTPMKKVKDLHQYVFAPSLCLDTSKDGSPTWRPMAFHNLGGRSNEDGFYGEDDAPVVDAVVASSSAPVYFPPCRYRDRYYVDGGTVATNPSALAVSAAAGAGLIGEGGIPFDEVRVLSLGTGSNATVFPPNDPMFPPPFGVLGWMWPGARGKKGDTPAFPLTSALEESNIQATDYQVRMLLKPDHYRRVQLSLGEDHIPLNSAAAVPRLIAMTNAYINDDNGEWDRIRRWVRDEFAR